MEKILTISLGPAYTAEEVEREVLGDPCPECGEPGANLQIADTSYHRGVTTITVLCPTCGEQDRRDMPNGDTF